MRRRWRAASGTGCTLIDLGAGDCAKAMRLIPVLRPARYVAVDISVEFLREALRAAQRKYPSLELMGIGADFSASLELPPAALTGRAGVLLSRIEHRQLHARPTRSNSCAACVRMRAAAGC